VDEENAMLSRLALKHKALPHSESDMSSRSAGKR
jgi:hypothetical protein